MGCAGCSINLKDGTPVGCRSNGNCGTGGCNRLNTYDWLATMDMEDVEPFHVVEVSFKNGARKAFFYNQPYTRAVTGDMVMVETQAGADAGRITLSGELVRLQMRKKRVKEDSYFPKVIRKANERDLEKLQEVRDSEKQALIRARAIARTLNLNMKIGDIEFQADGRKATFFYTADGRVDFRELIRHFAKEFKVKIEMRQIGARQESARVGGIGPCGRELCCSTWLTTYRTVSTAAARYQNLAINQAKLSGQCGRLKCCLNYELDTYMEALSSFPEDAEKLRTKAGVAVVVKTDIFKGLMYYSYEQEAGRGRMYALDLDKVRAVREMNLRGEFPKELADLQAFAVAIEPDEPDFEDVTGAIELPPDERRKRKKKKKKGGGKGDDSTQGKTTDQGEKDTERQRSKSGNNGERRQSQPNKQSQQQAKQPQEPRKPQQPPTNQSQNKPADRPVGDPNARNKNRNKDRRFKGKNKGGGDGSGGDKPQP